MGLSLSAPDRWAVKTAGLPHGIDKAAERIAADEYYGEAPLMRADEAKSKPVISVYKEKSHVPC